MRRFAARTLAVLLLAFTTSCGDGTTEPGNVEGTWGLRSINGNNVPVVVYQDLTYRLEIVSGSIVVNANETFRNVLTIRETEGSAAPVTSTIDCTGTYTMTGSSLSFEEDFTSEDCGGSYTGSRSGSTLTVAYDAQLQAVYVR